MILNSGGANACTGPGGFQDTHATAEAVAAALSNWGTETGAVEVAEVRVRDAVIGCVVIGLAVCVGMLISTGSLVATHDYYRRE